MKNKNFDSRFLLFLMGVVLIEGLVFEKASAQSQTFIRSAPGKPTSNSSPSGNRCSQIFKLRTYEVQVLHFGSVFRGGSQTQSEQLLSTQYSQHTRDWLDKTLSEWSQSGHYTPENIEFLRQREMALPPERTSYYSFEYAGRLSGIRIFDGSSLPLIDSVMWGEIDSRDSRTSIERHYSYRFAERDSPGDDYLWEVGLLSSPNFFTEGVVSNFHQLARNLDRNYNMNQMAAFGSTSQVDKLKFMIYGVSRSALVERYETLGFEKVIDEQTGNLVTFDDGMFLIRMSGATLLRNFFWERPYPETEGYSYTIKETGEGSRRRRAEENVQRMKGRRAYILNPQQAQMMLDQIYQQLLNLKKVHDQERFELNFSEVQRSWRGGSPREVTYLGQEQPTRETIEELWVVWNSLPEGMVPYSHWYYMRAQINFLLSIQNPSAAVEAAIEDLVALRGAR